MIHSYRVMAGDLLFVITSVDQSNENVGYIWLIVWEYESGHASPAARSSDLLQFWPSQQVEWKYICWRRFVKEEQGEVKNIE